MATSTAPTAAQPRHPARSRKPVPGAREQTRARYPAIEGVVERDGGRIAYEVYGAGDPPMVFVPPWQIVHSRIWKAQIPDFARRHLVVAWDNRGNGRSDRPTDPARPHDPRTCRQPGSGDGRGRCPRRGARRPVVILRTDARVRRRASGPRPRPRLRLPVFAVRGARSLVGTCGSRTAWRTTRAGTRRTSTSGVATTGPTSSSSSARRSASRTRPSRSRTASATASTRIRSRSRPRSGRRRPSTSTCSRRCVAGSASRRSSSRAPTTGSPTSARGPASPRAIPGARLELLEGGGHIVNARDPVRVNLLLRDFMAGIERGAGGSRR